jgi:hypothetical protein
MENLPTKAIVLRAIQLYFDYEELKTLTEIELGVDLDSLSGEGMMGKARELIAYVNRRGMAEALWNAITKARPSIVTAVEMNQFEASRFMTGPLIMPDIPKAAQGNGDAAYYKFLRDEIACVRKTMPMLMTGVASSIMLSVIGILLTVLFIVFGG